MPVSAKVFACRTQQNANTSFAAPPAESKPDKTPDKTIEGRPIPGARPQEFY